MCTMPGGRKGREDDVAQRWVTGHLPALVRGPCRRGGCRTVSRAAALTVAIVRKGFMGGTEHPRGGPPPKQAEEHEETHM